MQKIFGLIPIWCYYLFEGENTNNNKILHMPYSSQKVLTSLHAIVRTNTLEEEMLFVDRKDIQKTV